jgi:hypothetical protein
MVFLAFQNGGLVWIVISFCRMCEIEGICALRMLGPAPNELIELVEEGELCMCRYD